ncbi:MAG: PHP domain-containing protein [Oscillospiraceae bacterium]|nr:PHP domain-containing protein [Oscillospiraceae bacterium]
MKKYLLPKGLPFYKANLHCHSTASDGEFTPEELKAAYQAKGYSIIAYTDHEVMVPHTELNDDHFLALSGYETEIMSDYPLDSSFKYRQTCHICLIAPEPDARQVYWTNVYVTKMLRDKHPELVATYADVPDTKRVFSPEGISDLMQTARRNGFFVTYNHPYWSLVDYKMLSAYHGMHALEIYNHGCAMGGYDEYDPQLMDAMLRGGQRVYFVAADDNHGSRSRFGGWCMICAEKLEYRAVMNALHSGHFYASTGPQIKELWFEDGQLHISCSPAAKIVASFGIRKKVCIRKEDCDLTEAVIPVDKNDIYVRVTVWDEAHEHADTNAYFTEDLFA